MPESRVLLKVKRFPQIGNECAIASASSFAHFFDASLDYDHVRTLVTQKERHDGLWTSEQARLLNKLGFKSVSIITGDLSLVDFSWARRSKKRIIARMKEKRSYYTRIKDDERDTINDLIQWLEDEECDNRIIIEPLHNFAKYIRHSLRSHKPVCATINGTSLWGKRRGTSRGLAKNSDIHGEVEYHAIVLRGFDREGVFIVDPENGRYKLPWTKFLVNMPSADLIIA